MNRALFGIHVYFYFEFLEPSRIDEDNLIFNLIIIQNSFLRFYAVLDVLYGGV